MTHEPTCLRGLQDAAYAAFIRRDNTVADTYTEAFEYDPDCTCVRECAGCEKPQTDNYTIAGEDYCWSCFEAYGLALDFHADQCAKEAK